MSTDGEYAGHVELKCISRLYSDKIFRVYRSNDLTEFVDYGSGAIMCNLFFSSPIGAGHYDVLVFGNHINDKNVFISPKQTSSKAKSKHPKKLRRTHSLTERRERKNIMIIIVIITETSLSLN